MAAAQALPSAAPLAVTPELAREQQAWIEAQGPDSVPDFARDLVRRRSALRFARPALVHPALLPERRPLEQWSLEQWSTVANYSRPPSRPDRQRDRTSEQPTTRPGVLCA
jgi:hypothetical protein